MKRILLLSLLALAGSVASAQTVLINESFDTYNTGNLVSTVNPVNFAIWPGGGDQVVSEAYAHSGLKSMACVSTVAGGGPGDLLLLLGDKTTGFYTLSWWMYIPGGKGGYFNIQHTEDVSTPSFAAEMIFEDGGTISGMVDNTAIAGSYPQDAWFQVNLLFDLAAQSAVFAIGSTPVASWNFATETDGAVGPNQIGAIDFYSYGGGSPTIGEYYVDDIAYLEIPVGIEEIGANALLTFPNPAGEALYVDVPTSLVDPLAELCDPSGRVVATTSAHTSLNEALRMEMDLRTIAPGIYTLRVSSGHTILTRKIVKG